MEGGLSSFGDRRGVPLSGMKCMFHTGFSGGTAIHHSLMFPSESSYWKGKGTLALYIQSQPTFGFEKTVCSLLVIHGHTLTSGGKCCGFLLLSSQ